MTDSAPKITSPQGTPPLRDSTGRDSTDSTRTSSPKESSLIRRGEQVTDTQPRLSNINQSSENFNRVWQRFKNFFNLAQKFATFQDRRARVADLKKNYLVKKNAKMTPEVERLKLMLRGRVKLYARKVADLNETPRNKYGNNLRLTAAILNYHSNASALSPQNRAAAFSHLKAMDDLVGRKNERDLKAFEKEFPPKLSGQSGKL